MPSQISVRLRSRPAGGGPLRHLHATYEAFIPRRRLILLVHGYNVTEDKAESSYEKFEANLRRCAPKLARDVGWLFWPGDSTKFPHGALYYHECLETALRVAPELTQYLRRLRDHRGGRTQLVLVGHSLGCRLVLEALSNLLTDDAEWPRVTVFLMAAAVPVAHVDDGGRLHDVVMRASARHCLYSKWDKTLTRWFPKGQAIAKDPVEPPRVAVGLYGDPPLNLWTRRKEMLYLDHGDYWPTRAVTEYIARGLQVAVARHAPARALPLRASASTRASAAHRLQQRRMRSRRA